MATWPYQLSKIACTTILPPIEHFHLVPPELQACYSSFFFKLALNMRLFILILSHLIHQRVLTHAISTRGDSVRHWILPRAVWPAVLLRLDGGPGLIPLIPKYICAFHKCLNNWLIDWSSISLIYNTLEIYWNNKNIQRTKSWISPPDPTSRPKMMCILYTFLFFSPGI